MIIRDNGKIHKKYAYLEVSVTPLNICSECTLPSALRYVVLRYKKGKVVPVIN
jgi:hypothetical protein